MRAAQVSQSVREPDRELVAAGKAACLRTWGLGLVVPMGVMLLGGAWTTALVAACAALLAIVCERVLSRPGSTPTDLLAPDVPCAPGARGVPQSSFDGKCEQSRTVLEALGEGVLVVDAGGRIVLANPSVRSVMCKPTRDPEGSVLWEALVPEVAQMAQDAWRAVLDRSQAHPEQLPQVRHTGVPCRDRVYDLTAVEATSSRTGHRYGVLFLFVDSTRNFELQRLKDRFLSSVSHELRTPLTNICAYSEILRMLMPGESAEWPEFVRVIHEEGMQLSRLVDAMFDFLQLESGEALFRSEEVDGAEVVRAAARTFSSAAASRGVALQLVESAVAPSLECDRSRLRQVVRNLLDNALKFTPPGGRVKVTVGPRDEGWEMRIEDSGPGVPADDRRAVFEKFHQLPDHLTEKPSGTGLGLAISRAIVARFGGLIWCEETELGGAGFVVLLPGTGQPRLAAIAAGTGAGGGF